MTIVQKREHHGRLLPALSAVPLSSLGLSPGWAGGYSRGMWPIVRSAWHAIFPPDTPFEVYLAIVVTLWIGYLLIFVVATTWSREPPDE